MDRLQISTFPADLGAKLEPEFKGREGHAYSTFGDWFLRSRCKTVAQTAGYLDAQVKVRRGPVHTKAGQHTVDQFIEVDGGPQYRISSIDADGGPLLAGKDLTPLFRLKGGDVAGPSPFLRLKDGIWQLYKHFGYQDVEVEDNPVKDRDHAVVSYHLTVKPGPVYHLGSLKIEKLSSEQKAKVMDLFGMKPGGVYDEDAISNLYRSMAEERLLTGLSFSYGVKPDKESHMIDLSLEFFKKGEEGSVTVK